LEILKFTIIKFKNVQNLKKQKTTEKENIGKKKKQKNDCVGWPDTPAPGVRSGVPLHRLVYMHP
jgi:hypothetical protein